MLNNKGFDMWANDYDKSVGLSYENNVYPFAGYKDLLNTIYNNIRKKDTGKILDIGFGTATLTKKLYDDNYDIFGVDFSKEMINIAKQKMPNASLFCYDFSNGLPKNLKNEKFDFIISTYAIHHLTDIQKIYFFKLLYKMLNNNGKILIGDVAFYTKKELDKCRQDNIDYWDNDEIYITFDFLKQNLKEFNISFTPISFCSGIVCIEK